MPDSSDSRHCRPLETGSPVSVWILPCPPPPSFAQRRQGWTRILESWEQERLASIRSATACDEYLAAHLLIRFAMARVHPGHASMWRVSQTPLGKPVVLRTPDTPEIHLSLSHTRGLAGCVLAPAPVGLDLECCSGREGYEDTAPQIMSPEELRAFAEKSHDQRLRHLLKLWTLKEAMAKALGVGFAVSPADFVFASDRGEEWRLVEAPPVEEIPAEWSVRSFGIGRTYLGALAIAGRGGKPVAVDVMECRWQELAATLGLP